MLSSKTSLLVGVGFAAVVLGLAACGDGPTSPSGDANLMVNLTDDHTEDVQAVNLYFTSVTANPIGGPPETLMLALDRNPQDLLALRDVVIALATGIVEPGEYASLRINLDQERSNVVEAGEQLPLRIPSEEIKILGGFSVRDDSVTAVTLDFDAEASLVLLGNGEWLLQPVIIMDVSTTQR